MIYIPVYRRRATQISVTIGTLNATLEAARAKGGLPKYLLLDACPKQKRQQEIRQNPECRVQGHPKQLKSRERATQISVTIGTLHATLAAERAKGGLPKSLLLTAFLQQKRQQENRQDPECKVQGHPKHLVPRLTTSKPSIKKNIHIYNICI